LQIHILASGSSGNAIFLAFNQVKLLIDVGISARRIESELAGLGVKASELNGILITHEHSDHIKGLDVLARRHSIPIYAREATWNVIPCRDKLSSRYCRIIDEMFSIGEVEVEAFNILHDAVDPVGFVFWSAKRKYVVATDLGVVTNEVEEKLAYADAVILESNHDLNMLMNGSYPLYLKKRIRGNKGHLSNHDAGYALAKIPRNRPMQVFMAHLSQHNNHPDVAENTIREILSRHNCRVGEEVFLHRTYPRRTSSFFI